MWNQRNLWARKWWKELRWKKKNIIQPRPNAQHDQTFAFFFRQSQREEDLYPKSAYRLPAVPQAGDALSLITCNHFQFETFEMRKCFSVSHLPLMGGDSCFLLALSSFLFLIYLHSEDGPTDKLLLQNSYNNSSLLQARNSVYCFIVAIICLSVGRFCYCARCARIFTSALLKLRPSWERQVVWSWSPVQIK